MKDDCFSSSYSREWAEEAFPQANTTVQPELHLAGGCNDTFNKGIYLGTFLLAPSKLTNPIYVLGDPQRPELPGRAVFLKAWHQALPGNQVKTRTPPRPSH